MAAGWSHGGWTVLDALALAPGVEAEASTRLAGLPEEPLAGLVGAFVLYPYVGVASIARQRGLRYDASPVALVAGRDMTVGGRSVQRALARMPTPGAPVRIEWLDAATHAFDEPDAHDLRVRFDAALTAKAQGMLAEYLAARAGAGGASVPIGAT